jgi:hypothetical protein
MPWGNNNNMKYTCPCCSYKTLPEKPPGTFEICPVCHWEDDNAQFNDSALELGANNVSLRQAQQNFCKFGACEIRLLRVVRPPGKDDEKDSSWKME